MMALLVSELGVVDSLKFKHSLLWCLVFAMGSDWLLISPWLLGCHF